jgi:serine/threonine protein kinase
MDTIWKSGEVILGEYLIEKELGRGGMGCVWLVKSQSTGRHFAVKQALLKEEKHRRAFLTELQTWIDLPEHPNIVPCRFFRTVGDEIVIFTDYIDGGSLAEWIAKGKLSSLEQILDVSIRFAWGLHAIHEHGLIHQDVKPGNVLMTAKGVPMVADFGLASARQFVPDSGFESSTQLIGQHSILVPGVGLMTTQYASPEQRAGQPLSSKTDMWSWGVSVLDIIIGGVSCPHGGHFADSILKACSVDDSNYIYAKYLYPILDRALKRNASDRWPSMKDASDCLISQYTKLCRNHYPHAYPTAAKKHRYCCFEKMTLVLCGMIHPNMLSM